MAARMSAAAGRSWPAAERALPVRPVPGLVSETVPGLVSEMAPGAVSEAARSRPTPALRPFIAYYSGYRQAGVGPARHRGLPSPYLTLIFTLDEPLTVAAHPDPGQPPRG